MDLLRSCYEVDFRFFANVPDTTRVRWYFVPEGTPWVPFPNAFVSANWDSDPKPETDHGEQWPGNRSWANGLPSWLFRGDQPCGTEEQWAEGTEIPPGDQDGDEEGEEGGHCTCGVDAPPGECALPLMLDVEGVPEDEDNCQNFNGRWFFCQTSVTGGKRWDSTRFLAFLGDRFGLRLQEEGSETNSWDLQMIKNGIPVGFLLYHSNDVFDGTIPLTMTLQPDGPCDNWPPTITLFPAIQRPLMTDEGALLLTDKSVWIEAVP